MFNRRTYIAALAMRHAVPTIYPLREFAAAGGLMSYGSSIMTPWDTSEAGGRGWPGGIDHFRR
jgi:hypothetical protein